MLTFYHAKINELTKEWNQALEILEVLKDA
jgi:hypothetical protein